MNLSITSALLFLITIVFIEWTIEAIRIIIFLLQHNKLPKKFFILHSDKNINLVLSVFESATIAYLLYVDYHPVVILLIGFISMFILQRIIALTGKN